MQLRYLLLASMLSGCALLEPDPSSSAYQWGYAQAMKVNRYCASIYAVGTAGFATCQKALDATIPPYPGSQLVVWTPPPYQPPDRPVICTPDTTQGSYICQ